MKLLSFESPEFYILCDQTQNIPLYDKNINLIIENYIYQEVHETCSEQLTSIIRTKYGIKHGSYQVFDNNNQLRKQCFYHDGLLHGEFKEWWSNGNLKMDTFYNNDALHTQHHHLFFENGSLWISMSYIQGIKTDELIVYRSNGSVYQTHRFDDKGVRIC